MTEYSDEPSQNTEMKRNSGSCNKCFNNRQSMIQTIMVNESETLGHLTYSAQSIWILIDISQDNQKVCQQLLLLLWKKWNIYHNLLCQ